MEFSKEAQAALHKMIHHTKGVDAKQIAEVLCDSHKTVCNYGNLNMDYLPSLKSLKPCFFLRAIQQCFRFGRIS